MAIITNIYHIHKFLGDCTALEYLYSVCNEAHKNRLRIFELPLKTCRKECISPNFFALEQNYMTKSRNECFWESHKNFIDICTVKLLLISPSVSINSSGISIYIDPAVYVT